MQAPERPQGGSPPPPPARTGIQAPTSLDTQQVDRLARQALRDRGVTAQTSTPPSAETGKGKERSRTSTARIDWNELTSLFGEPLARDCRRLRLRRKELTEAEFNALPRYEQVSATTRQNLFRDLCDWLLGNRAPLSEERLLGLYQFARRHRRVAKSLFGQNYGIIIAAGEVIDRLRQREDCLVRRQGSSNGVYVGIAQGMKLIVKPAHEEVGMSGHSGQLTVRNQEGELTTVTLREGQGLRRGIPPGRGPVNELLAYRYAFEVHGYRGVVPRTVLVRMHNRPPFARGPDMVLASLQLYVNQADFDLEEALPQMHRPRQKLQLWRIANLHIDLGNTDAHSGNFLVKRAEGRLMQIVAVDHGLIASWDPLEMRLEWRLWEQLQQPLPPRMVRRLLAEDPRRAMALLNYHQVPQQARIMARLRIALKQHMIRRGFFLSDVANVLDRLGGPGGSHCEFALMVTRAATHGTYKDEEAIVGPFLEKARPTLRHFEIAVQGAIGRFYSGEGVGAILSRIDNPALRGIVQAHLGWERRWLNQGGILG